MEFEMWNVDNNGTSIEWNNKIKTKYKTSIVTIVNKRKKIKTIWSINSTGAASISRAAQHELRHQPTAIFLVTSASGTFLLSENWLIMFMGILDVSFPTLPSADLDISLIFACALPGNASNYATN